MARLLIEELRGIEGPNPDPGCLGTTVVRLILSSRQIEATVYDSDVRTGTYVLVLEGTLDIGARAQDPGDGVCADRDGDGVTTQPGSIAAAPGAHGRIRRPEA